MTSGFRFAPGGRERLLLLDDLLDAAYSAPEALLGNQPDALDEAIYIILSFQTDLPRFQGTWRNLRSAFPRWEDANEHQWMKSPKCYAPVDFTARRPRPSSDFSER